MHNVGIIYVSLLDEAIDVWRPVQAEHLRGDVYRIIEQPYDRELEHWQFEPGEIVVCKNIALADDGIILAAVKRESGDLA